MRQPLLLAATLTLVTTFTAGLAAQELQRDSTWMVSSATDDSLFFVVMRPGWHVTTSSQTTLYQPDSTAAGNYVLKSVIYFFDETDQPYGVILGGQNMGGDSPSYLVFELRNDGWFAIRHRAGSEMHQLQEWTASDAIQRKTAESPGPVKNILAVFARGNEADFFINGTRVASIAAPYLDTEGVFGLEAGGGVNLHVGQLTVTSLGD